MFKLFCVWSEHFVLFYSLYMLQDQMKRVLKIFKLLNDHFNFLKIFINQLYQLLKFWGKIRKQKTEKKKKKNYFFS